MSSKAKTALFVAGGVMIAAAGVLSVSLAFMPVAIDRLRYPDIPPGCSGVLSYSAEVSGQTLGGRHCHTAAALTTTESGGVVSIEFADSGRVFVYTDQPIQPNATQPVRLAMIRGPGPDAGWFCASSGTLQAAADKFKGSVALDGLRKIEWGAAAEPGKLALTNGKIEGLLGRATTSTRPWATSCDSERRCALNFGEETAMWRLWVRGQSKTWTLSANEPINHAVILAENERAATRVVVGEAKSGVVGANGTDVTAMDVPAIRLIGICDAKDERGPGRATVAWH